jgi:hypothetical protein
MIVFRYEKPFTFLLSNGRSYLHDFIINNIPKDTEPGPYSWDIWPFADIIRTEHSSEDHRTITPGAVEDFYPQRIMPGYLYACPSFKGLLRWFDGWHVRLNEWGFQIVKYDAIAPLESKSGLQVAFKEFSYRKVIDYQ